VSFKTAPANKYLAIFNKAEASQIEEPEVCENWLTNLLIQAIGARISQFRGTDEEGTCRIAHMKPDFRGARGANAGDDFMNFGRFGKPYHY